LLILESSVSERQSKPLLEPTKLPLSEIFGRSNSVGILNMALLILITAAKAMDITIVLWFLIPWIRSWNHVTPGSANVFALHHSVDRESCKNVQEEFCWQFCHQSGWWFFSTLSLLLWPAGGFYCISTKKLLVSSDS
jgi:hypothetical protein